MRRFLTIGITLLAFAVIPVSASAGTLSPVIRDCQNNGGLKHHYSIPQLRQALRSLTPTVAEYGNCQQIIQNQLLSQEGKPIKGGGGTGGGKSGGSSSTVLIVVIVVVVVLLVAGGGFLYARRRTDGGDSEEPPPPGA